MKYSQNACHEEMDTRKKKEPNRVQNIPKCVNPSNTESRKILKQYFLLLMQKKVIILCND